MSTPGSYKKIFYSGASDSFPFTFKKSDGSAYDISSYSSYELNFYKINETTVDTSVSMTLTGTNVLDNTFTVSDIQALPKAGRYELLLTNSAEDKDITIRDSFEVTDVQGDQTVTSGTEVTIDTEGVVVSVSSVTLSSVGASINNASSISGLDDADTFGVYDDSESGFFNVAWSVIKSTFKSYYDSVTATLTNKTLTSPAETVQTLGSISGTNDVDVSQGTIITATLTGATALTFSGAPSSNEISFVLKFSGAETISWPANTIFAGGEAPSITGPDYEIPCSIDSSGIVTVHGIIDEYATV